MNGKKRSKRGKWYPMVPGGAFVALVMICGCPAFSWAAYDCIVDEGAIFAGIISALFALFYLFFAWYFCVNGVHYFKISDGCLECFTPLRPRIRLEYGSCNIGIDYHIQSGRALWWIYLCYGEKPPYKKQNDPRNRMNTIPCSESFVRMMYNEDLYNELLEVLPSKQRAELMWAKGNTIDRMAKKRKRKKK